MEDYIKAIVSDLNSKINFCFEFVDMYGSDACPKEELALLEERYRIREMLEIALKKGAKNE